MRPVLVELLLQMLNAGVTPVVPQKGSLGASGDLAPLSHIGLVLLGRGEAFYQGRRLPGRQAMEQAGLCWLETLVSKEGLGITNGTCAMTSVGALHLYDALHAAALADLISSMTFTALGGQLDAFQERLHTARGQLGQIQVAANLRRLTAGCEMLEKSQGLVRKGVRPQLSALLTMRSMRRSEMEASSAQAMPRKSKGRAMGSPWKLPPEITAPSSQKSRGLSVTAFSSISTRLRINASASRTAPWTWGMQRRA